MDIDLADLPDNVETLQRMVRTLATERANLTEAQAEIERLRLIVQKLQRSQFGRRAERLDDDQLQFGFEDLHADIARVEATLPPTTVRTPRSRPDRPSLPAHLPREDMRLDLEHQACPCCGGELHVIAETVSEMLDHSCAFTATGPTRFRLICHLKCLVISLPWNGPIRGPCLHSTAPLGNALHGNLRLVIEPWC
jgi:transposase